MRKTGSIIAISLLAACDAATKTTDAIARDQAKSVVNSVVTDRFPGVNAAPVTDCIIDAASAGEIVSIASASVTGVTEKTIEQVLNIARRQDAVNCVAENSLILLAR